ncbi:hypothetical protein V6N11_083117 [Hibiscus sabdariffa]|uniref:PUM-HD domain-containing protein n=1 Tax=Hibiscus sabdariffa TaxID=183260 RepID=A0ABR2QKY9_9ROSI
MLESTAKIGRKNRGNMKDDEELDKLLDEIPHATSPHHHVHQQHDNNHVNRSSSFHGMCLVHDDDISSNYYKHNTCTSPVSGLSLQSDGSSSSLFSNNGSQTPPFEDLKPHLSNGLFLEFDPSVRRKSTSSDSSLIGEMGLFRNLSKMYISNDQENVGSSFRDFYLESNPSNGVRVNDHIDVENYGACEKPRKGFSDVVGIQSPVPMSVPLSFNGGVNMAFSGLPQQDALISQLGMNCWNGATMRSPWQKKEPACSYHRGGVSVSNLSSSLSKLSVNDALIYRQRNCPSWNEGRGELNFHGSPRFIQATPQSVLPLSNGMTRSHSNVKMPRGCQDVEDSYIIQAGGLNYVINKGPGYARAQNKGSLQEIGASKCLERAQIGAACGNAKNAKLYSPFPLPPKYNSLAEARGYIYLIAKDQHGCRFLQRLFDDGTRQDVQMIFKEIIDHVVELMMNPFGNYLIQKLLEVCNEEQRMQILLMVTEEPGKLVKISLNTHGTRVVQKLIETLKTRQQISLVISALAPGFLSLIKDLNGNHVVQRCLQCLSSEDNNIELLNCKFHELFMAVDILMFHNREELLRLCSHVVALLHSHSTGEYKKKLLEEISANGLLLAQDAYGNYVVQFILELKIPSATSTLTSQFEGNYVHLSLQKFSSHVVEKCLVVLTDDGRSRIIRELLSATHFEQLLQDPHANYVVQTAVRVSEGPLHNSLVEAIESRKAISRNSPYSKRIFSQKLLKKKLDFSSSLKIPVFDFSGENCQSQPKLKHLGGMSDLCMYELEDNVWDDFEDTDDHIVPRTADEYSAQLKVQGDSKKRSRLEVIGVTGDTEYSPDSVFPTSGDNDSLKEVTTMASDDPRMSSHGLETGSDFCSDDPLLVDKCATEDNNDYRFPLNHITAADDDLRFFNNNHEDKENGDLLYYGLGDIGNFEDVDRMFRSCDSTFGLGSFGNEDYLYWLPSSQLAEGSQDALKADAKLNSIQEDCPTSRPASAANKESESKDYSTPSEQISPQEKHSKQHRASGERKDKYLENGDLQRNKQNVGPDSVNYVQSMKSSHGPFEAPAIITSEKRGKLYYQQDRETPLNRNAKHANMESERAVCDPITIQNQVCQSEQDECRSEVEGVSVVNPAELDSSNARESSCVISPLDEVSLEASSFRQLQQVMEKLDIRTKLCIRDSLYRLARSAEQRHNCSKTKGGIRDDKDEDASGSSVADETNTCTGFMDMETDTNPIDRSIAHLLFHRPVIDTAPVKSHGMIHGSITNPPLMLSEKQVGGNESNAAGSDKKMLTNCDSR